MKTVPSLLAGVCILIGAWSAAAEPAADWSADVLRRNGIEAEPAALLGYLKRVERAADLVPRLIAQLGDDDYETREAAGAQLKAFGPLVRGPLQRAAQDKDVEIASRAKKLLEALNDEPVLYAVLDQIARRKVPGAAAAVLAVLPFCPDPAHRDKAQEVVWATASAKDAALFQAKRNDADEATRAAAIVGLEASQGADAVPPLRPLLKGDKDRVRLAAARALVNHVPGECLPVLVELTKSTDDAVRVQSHYLLRELTGEKVDLAILVADPAPNPWERWLDRHGKTAELRLPLGEARWRLRGIGYYQTFAQDQAVEQGYGAMNYFDGAQGKAFTKGGRLHLGGTHIEGDQRLRVSSLAAFGARTFPAEFQVQARLGGQAGQAGTWHVGLSIGNVRLLFHPGFEQGAFRAERVDTKTALLPNENLGFTPVGNELYQMSVKVVRAKEDVRFAVTVQDAKRKFKPFEKQFAARPDEAGDLSQVGLERSGRLGGDALFEWLLIEPTR